MNKKLEELWSSETDKSNGGDGLSQYDKMVLAQSFLVGTSFITNRFEEEAVAFNYTQVKRGFFIHWLDDNEKTAALWSLMLRKETKYFIPLIKQTYEKIQEKSIPVAHIVQYNPDKSIPASQCFELFMATSSCYLSHKNTFYSKKRKESKVRERKDIAHTKSLFQTIDDKTNVKIAKVFTNYFDSMAKKMGNLMKTKGYTQEVDNSNLWLIWKQPNIDSREILLKINDPGDSRFLDKILLMCDKILNGEIDRAFFVLDRSNESKNPEKIKIFDMFMLSSRGGITYVNRYSTKKKNLSLFSLL